jgi:chromosomal replication initiator protein
MIDIQEPSFELRTAILLIKSQASNLDISMELAQLIASKVSSARKLEGLIASIRSEIELKHRQLSRELIEELLDHETPEMTARLRVGPDQVFKTVANHYRIKQIVIKGRKRQQDVVRARHVAMYLFKSNLNYSYVEIGRWFSNRDHTSVMHAVNKITDNLKTDLQLQQEVAAIKTSLAAVSR